MKKEQIYETLEKRVMQIMKGIRASASEFIDQMNKAIAKLQNN